MMIGGCSGVCLVGVLKRYPHIGGGDTLQDQYNPPKQFLKQEQQYVYLEWVYHN